MQTHKPLRKKQVAPNATVPATGRTFSSHRNKICQPRNTSQNQPTPRSRLLARNTARPTVPQTRNDRADFATWEGKIQLSHSF